MIGSVTIVLLHSPLLDAGASWGELPARLGGVVVVPAVRSDQEAPFAGRYVDAVVATVAGRADAVTLVPHSGAGPLAAAVAAALGPAVRRVIFLDAGLPVGFVPGLPAGAHRRDLLAAESPEAAAGLTALLDAGDRFPNWTADQLTGLVPNPAAIVAGMRPRGADFFTEPLPATPMPPGLDLAYIQLSETYAPYTALAAAAGWPVRTADLGHFGAAAAPESVAALIGDLLA